MTGRPWIRAVLPVAALAAASAALFLGTRPGPAPAFRARLELDSALGGAGDFARALAPRPFGFPADHGPHPEYHSEWWYFTGNLRDPAGRPYGFQLTFFRTALGPRLGAPRPASAWAAGQVYMGHLALSDSAAGLFLARERFGRAALGQAGARAGTDSGLRVWIGGWEARQDPVTSRLRDPFPLRLRARQGGIGLELELGAGKPPVAQGRDGLSAKGPEPGNASYYYSYTRLPAEGRLEFPGGFRAVRGEAWMDREWGTTALGPDRAGWDWFALRLDEGSELMYYRFRRRDGKPDPFSAGVWVDPSGRPTVLAPADMDLRALGAWTSPDGIGYPSGWRLRIPSRGLDLEVTPMLRDQELRLSLRYWEGAVGISGRAGGAAVRGDGFAELTGYGP